MFNSIFDEIIFLTNNFKLIYYFDLNIYYQINILLTKLFILNNFIIFLEINRKYFN